jgi:outer membrane protein assembly factor BamB
MRRLLLVPAFAAAVALSVVAADWPQWRGPGRDNKVTDFTVPTSWPAKLNPKWKVKVGDGVASPVLVGDRLYAFTREGGDEVVRCLEAGTGKEVWKGKYPAVEITGPAGGFKGPRGTPAVAEGKVCAFGVGGTISCFDAGSGQLAWRKETKGTPGFKTSYSPVIAEGKCVVHSGGGRGKGGGKGEVVAYDLKDGNEAWKWQGDAPAYSSPVLMTVDGTKMVVTMSASNVLGIGLADGKLLWQARFSASRYGNTVTPLVDGSTIIYAGSGTGTVAATVEKTADGFKLRQLWKSDQSPHLYNTPTLKDGKIYGLSGSGRGASKLYCLDAKTGDVLWTDATPRGECGAILDAGPVLLALSSDSNLLAFKPSDRGYEELAKIKVADSPTWTVPVVTGSRVFVKDKDSVSLLTFE